MKNKHSNIELFVDKLIPFLVIILGIILALEFTIDIHEYEIYLRYFDYFIVTFFVLDLFFKWKHTKNIKKFVKLYWIDIIAVFPFYLIFRVYLFLTEIAKATEEAQKILHEAVLIKETKVTRFFEVMREAEFTSKETRFVGRTIRFIQRFIRFLKGRIYFSRAAMLHHHIEIRKIN